MVASLGVPIFRVFTVLPVRQDVFEHKGKRAMKMFLDFQ